MSSNSEMLRNELAAHLAALFPPESVRAVLAVFDLASSGFDISRKPVSLIPSEPPFPEVVKCFLTSKAIANCSAKTLDQYRYKLTAFFQAVRKPVRQVTPNDIRLYLYHYKKARSVGDHTLEHTRIILHAFFQWAEENEYVPRNPAAKIERIRYQEPKRAPLTPYELEELRWNCRTLREKALVDFLFSTGCRVSECAGTDLADIDWTARSVFIRHGKGGKARTVYFNAEAELSLRKYLEARSDADPAVFVRSRAPFCRLSARSIELAVKKISRRSDIPVCPHRLRHTFATAGIRGGIPLERLQSLLGHANPRTTLIYARIDAADLQRDHQRVYS